MNDYCFSPVRNVGQARPNTISVLCKVLLLLACLLSCLRACDVVRGHQHRRRPAAPAHGKLLRPHLPADGVGVELEEGLEQDEGEVQELLMSCPSERFPHKIMANSSSPYGECSERARPEVGPGRAGGCERNESQKKNNNSP